MKCEKQEAESCQLMCRVPPPLLFGLLVFCFVFSKSTIAEAQWQWEVSLGGGLTYQLERGDSDDGDAKWNFVPIYGLIHLNFPAALVDFFAAGHIGYNILTGNDDMKDMFDLGGGLYYAIGGGVKLPLGLQFELLYTVNNGTLEGDYLGQKVESDFKVSQFSLSVGLNF